MKNIRNILVRATSPLRDSIEFVISFVTTFPWASSFLCLYTLTYLYLWVLGIKIESIRNRPRPEPTPLSLADQPMRPSSPSRVSAPLR
jgi:hypothetical protein